MLSTPLHMLRVGGNAFAVIVRWPLDPEDIHGKTPEQIMAKCDLRAFPGQQLGSYCPCDPDLWSGVRRIVIELVDDNAGAAGKGDGI